MSELFNVMFSGEISGRADPAMVRANVGKMFNASEPVLDKLFSGQPVAVKKMVDRATAMKVRAMLKQAGADAKMVAVDEQGRPLANAGATATSAISQPTPVPAAKPAKAPANSMAARVAVMARQHEIENAAKPKPNDPPPPAVVENVSTWALYPVGARLSVPAAVPVALKLNIASITMAKSGSDLIAENEKPKTKPVQVDISSMSMAAPQTDVLKESERKKVVPVQVDISGMSVAEVGAPLDEIRENKPPVKVDISHIQMA